MLKLSFEFRKGIFFIRLLGDLNKDSVQKIEKELNTLIINNKFKYVVVNTNYLSSVSLDGLNYITKIYYIALKCDTNLVICDKFKIFKTLLNGNVPLIDSELDVL